MIRVHESMTIAGRVLMATVTRRSVDHALANAEADLPGELGRPVWAAFAALGCAMSERMMEAEAAVEAELSGSVALPYVDLFFFPDADDLFMRLPGEEMPTPL